MTWSVLNTLVGLVYIPICIFAGGGFQVDSDTQRSGTFCYLASPRGPGWRMTLGTVIAAAGTVTKKSMSGRRGCLVLFISRSTALLAAERYLPPDYRQANGRSG